jgi:hypothetical protein
MKTPRAIIGKSELGPFDGLSYGDIFADLDGNRWVLGGSSTWTLYRENDGKPDYSNAHPDFREIDGGMAFKRILSRIKDEKD